ncbi:MAG TPA: lysine--tRNA ligase, partial [Candidatus Bathyarchaeia archaeon]|nr:lysine--tRNA ligase [Candidatus Bathyarchaeia archaeon]
MFWPDRFASEIIKSGKYRPYHVDDMKTPSGRIHVGALRGVIVHDLIFKALKEKGKKVDYTWVFNDMDPMDAFPHYLPEKFKK